MVARPFLLAMLALGGAPLTLGDEKVEAVVDYVRGDTLYVDGQRIVLQGSTRYKGARPEGAASVPPGTWARAKGPREASGAILATEVELRAANPNESHEAEIKAACGAASASGPAPGAPTKPKLRFRRSRIGGMTTAPKITPRISENCCRHGVAPTSCPVLRSWRLSFEMVATPNTTAVTNKAKATSALVWSAPAPGNSSERMIAIPSTERIPTPEMGLFDAPISPAM